MSNNIKPIVNFSPSPKRALEIRRYVELIASKYIHAVCRFDGWPDLMSDIRNLTGKERKWASQNIGIVAVLLEDKELRER